MKIPRILTVALLLLIVALPLFAQKVEVLEKSFKKVDDLKIDLILGDCRIEKSKDSQIHIRLEYTYDDDDFEARFRERRHRLIVEEKFIGRNPRGYSNWMIQVPNDVEVNYHSATGDIEIVGLDIEIRVETGTGEIELMDCSGDFDIHSGTGSLDVHNCKGSFDLHSGTGEVIIESCKGNFNAQSGTGDVEVKDVEIEYEAEFSSGTGDAEVTGVKGSDFDLRIESGTGDAVLDMGGQPLKGHFKLSCLKRHGRIRSSFKFDDERTVGRGDEAELVKILTRGSRSTQYSISTGTGRAVLKK
ncbi:DUF4097 family beta strand repeat protein [bacterium]|nr:DUF4097 family beta strand repeat protein [bacterium]